MGSATPVGRDAAQIVEQHVGIVVHGRDAVRGEELGKEAHHHLAVLEHVRDARGHAQVVLEHAELARHRRARCRCRRCGRRCRRGRRRLASPGGIASCTAPVRGDDARFQDLLVVVDIVNEGVQSSNALLQAAFETDPLFQGNDARHDVEGDEAFGALFLTVDGEGDSHAVKQGIGLGALLAQALGRLVFEPMVVAQVVLPCTTLAQIHFAIRFVGQKIPSSGTQRIPCQSSLPHGNHGLRAFAPQ